MRWIYVALMLWVCHVTVMATDHSYEEKCRALQEYPRTVLKEAREVINSTYKDKLSPQFIDALMQVSAAQLLIDTDSTAAVVDNIEQKIMLCDNAVDRSIIALYLSELYADVLGRRYYYYERQSYIKGNEEIATWNTRNFYDKIDSLHTIALQPARLLQKSSIDTYRLIIGIDGYEGNDAWKWVKKFYPTMYDFVVRVIYSDVKAHYRNELDSTFIQEELEKIVRYHSRHRHDAARFMWHLTQLQYDYRDVPHNEEYCVALDALIDRYASKSFVIEAVIARYSVPDFETSSTALKERYDRLMSWVERYPHYYRTDVLRMMCAELSAVSVSAMVQEVIPLGSPVNISLIYRNVESLRYELSRCVVSTPMQDISEAGKLPKEYISRNTMVCEGIDFADHHKELCLDTLGTGVYCLEIVSGNERDSILFVVMPYMLYTINALPQATFVMLSDMNSNQPVAGEMLLLNSTAGGVVDTLFTDDNGMCRIDRKRYPASCYISLANMAHNPFRTRIDAVHQYTSKVEPRVQLFTDRSIYRPGQKLLYSALVYLRDDDNSTVVENKLVPVEILDNNYNVVARDTIRTDRYGSVYGEFAIPDKASPGRWILRVRGNGLVATQYIDVAEYKRPQFRVECNAIEGIYSYGDSVQVTGFATNYMGTPVAFAAVKYAVRRFSYMRSGGEIVAQGESRTDADGGFMCSFFTSEPQEEYWRMWGARYVVEVVVTADNGESQSGEAYVSVSGSSVMFRLNFPEKVCSDNKQDVEVTIVNGNHTPQQLPYKVALYSLQGRSVGQSLQAMHRCDTAMWTKHQSAGESNVALPYDMLQSGAYRIITSTIVKDGTIVKDSTDFVYYSPCEVRPPIPVAMWLPTSSLVVADGDTAHIAVGSSFSQVVLSCFISDGDKQVEYRRYNLDDSIVTIDIPFDASCHDVVQLLVVLTYGREVYSNSIDIVRKQPDMQLIITPTTFRDKTISGSREKWQFTVRNVQGEPVDALFMAELYDASLDALKAHSWHFNPSYYPSVKNRLSAAYRWYYMRDRQAYINYYTETAGQYVGEVLPILNNYLHVGAMSYGVTMRGGGKYVAMVKNSVEEVEMESANVTMDYAEEADVAVEEVVVEKPTLPAVADYRSNMVETAFFYPHLVTDKEGKVVVEFTLPESNTTWNFISLAVTPQLYNGMYSSTIVSSKPLMVQPNMPRFVRQGDETTLSAIVYNTTQDTLQGEAYFTLYNPGNEQVVWTMSKSVVLPSNATATVDFKFSVPDTIPLMGVRIGATAQHYSDGEQHMLAVLPSWQYITEAKPFYVPTSTRDTKIVFDAMQQQMMDGEACNKRVTLEYCDNPAWYAVTALPPLAVSQDKSATSIMASFYANVVAQGIVKQNAHIASAISQWSESNSSALKSQLEKNEELKQMLLQQTPWLLEAQNSTEQMQQIATLLDGQRAQELAMEAVNELQAMQSSQGGWAWFDGMQPSFAMTLNIVAGLSRLSQWGEYDYTPMVASMKIKALQFLDNEYVRRNARKGSPDYYDLCYLYVRSANIDVPLVAEARDIHRAQLDSVANTWYMLDEIEKAYAAVALYRYGYIQQAEDIVRSLREYAVTTPAQGMYWANNRSSVWYRNSAIQVHCAIYEAFVLISPVTMELDAMRQWLLMQKQTQSWGNVPSTLDAVSILLLSGSNWLGNGSSSQLLWGDKKLPKAQQVEQILGYEKYVREGKDVDANDAVLRMTHQGDNPSWGALYWQYQSPIAHVEAYKSESITLLREYYVMRDGDWVSIENTQLKVGDEITVRLSFYIDRDMQFLSLVDYRPACLEPTEQLAQYRWCGTTYCYCSPADASMSFYFDYVAKGTHVVEYRTYVDRVGLYNTGAATLQSYYAPQYVAHSEGTLIAVD
ncbi:MAG: hypothetical protein E7084_04515 [Bacteroidales bacterium]|nr:hypothetical protein [Bacteroidales bacterium]